ncbi:hypothetical protein dsx2_1942 [Desulfovibrio sp. X2]|nr:hypothetical protein dsx2_1942 [Desulfovibrio sp. X2]
MVESDGQPWPAPWDGYLQRVRKPARVVFSYWDLFQDLGPEPSRERRDVWRRLLEKLAWPAGTVAFWPLCEPSGQAVLAKPALFWRGVAELQAATVVLFGKRAGMTLFPDRPFAYRSFSMARQGGPRVVVLPGPGELVARNVQAMKLVLSTLQTLSLD